MQVNVRLFAVYRERAGRNELRVELPAGATVADLVRLVDESHPGLCFSPNAMVVAVNQEYAQRTHRLQPGDEVALIPPVSGGAHVYR